jgi:hypothetical protein
MQIRLSLSWSKPKIIAILSRMMKCFKNKDFSGLLHAISKRIIHAAATARRNLQG